MKLILWIQVEIVYNGNIQTVLMESLKKFAQEQQVKLTITSCQHHPPQPDPESATASYLPPPPPRPVIFSYSSSISSSSSGCQPAAKKKKGLTYNK